MHEDIIIDIKPISADKIAKMGVVTIVITRYLVESMCLDTFEAQIDELRKAGLDAKEKLSILFDGYNGDTLEIYDIPEVFQFVRRMLEISPEILFYLTPKWRGLLYQCVFDVVKIPFGNGFSALFFKDTTDNRSLYKTLVTNRDNYIQKVSASKT